MAGAVEEEPAEPPVVVTQPAEAVEPLTGIDGTTLDLITPPLSEAWPMEGDNDGDASSVEPTSSTVTWTGDGGDGNWHNGANWSGGMTPGQGEHVVIDAVEGITVEHGASETTEIASLTSSSPIELSNGTLRIAEDSTVAELHITGATVTFQASDQIGESNLNAGLFYDDRENFVDGEQAILDNEMHFDTATVQVIPEPGPLSVLAGVSGAALLRR